MKANVKIKGREARITSILTPPVFEKVRRRAFRERRSMSSLVRMWIEEKVKPPHR